MWTIWVVAALLLLDVLNLTVYGVVTPLSALVIAVTVPGLALLAWTGAWLTTGKRTRDTT